MSLIDFYLENNYFNFNYLYRCVKRELLRPITHLSDQVPILQKSLLIDELADFDNDDYDIS